MQDAIYQYLILYKTISLPGIGTISLQRKPAEHDFGNKVFTAPAFYFKMDSEADIPSASLFKWLSGARQISEWDAIRMVNDFSQNLKNTISSTGEFNWEKLGNLHRDDKGNIVLESQSVQLKSEAPVPAEKVLRVKAEHTVRVGEMEKTSSEMEELLSPEDEKKDFGWSIAIVAVILSLMFIGWYFSENGIQPSSTGNQTVIKR